MEAEDMIVLQTWRKNDSSVKLSNSLAQTFSIQDYKNLLFEVRSADFERLAHKAVHLQISENSVLYEFSRSLQMNIGEFNDLTQFPFLPIRFFKSHPVISGSEIPALYFESSGTTGQDRSRHYIADPELYLNSLTKGFEQFFGAAANWQVVALLPGYLEQPHASLVYMMRHLMEHSRTGEQNFYLNQYDDLSNLLQKSEEAGMQTLLVGVTHALLDFAEKYPIRLTHTRVLETGGMKGRKKEMIREEVHAFLKQRFGLETIYSEYGMTELLSQAYALKDGIFHCPPWMKVLVRDEDDPLRVQKFGRGALNIIDLANIHSCCFIATDDVGEVYEDGSFRVLGRMDQSEWRGCSLMVV